MKGLYYFCEKALILGSVSFAIGLVVYLTYLQYRKMKHRRSHRRHRARRALRQSRGSMAEHHPSHNRQP
jgi:RNase P protein component